MLTDETIRKIFDEEKNSQGLTRLPEDFFEQVSDYISSKSEMVKTEADKWSLDAVKRRLSTIFEMRERKILNYARAYVDSDVVPDNLTPEESKFFEKIVECIKDFQKRRERKLGEGDDDLMLLTMLKEVPKFVGTNMKNYGPFAPGDIATVPSPNADLLITKELARKTEISG